MKKRSPVTSNIDNQFKEKSRKLERKAKRQQRKIGKDTYYKSKYGKPSTNCDSQQSSVVENNKYKRKINEINKKTNNKKAKKKARKVSNETGGGLQIFEPTDRISKLQEFVKQEANKMHQDDHKFKKKNCKLEVKNSDAKEKSGGGLKFSAVNDRMAQLQAFVNKESNQKLQEDIPQKRKKSTKANDKNIEVEVLKSAQLQRLELDQKKEISNIKKYERKLHLLAHHKKAGKVSREFRDDFGSILEDIESGKMENDSLYENNNEEEFQNDLFSASRKQNKEECLKNAIINNFSKNEEDSSNVGESVDMPVYDSDENECDSDDLDSFIVGDDVVEYQERPVNHHRRISDTESEPSPQKINRKKTAYKDYSESEDDGVGEFFDDEAEEGDESETEEYDEENIIFEGSSMKKGNNFPKLKRAQKTLFDTYDDPSSEDEGSDSEMDDFVVPDSCEEFCKDESILEKCFKKYEKNSNKRRRIKSLEDSDSDSNCDKKRKLNNAMEDAPKDKENNCGEEYHEDIYGRLRDKKGNIVSNNEVKLYRTPAECKLGELKKNKDREEQKAVLKKQLKGMMNRLTDGTMQGVANQVEALYKKNSRNDMSETLTALLFNTFDRSEPAPNRLIQEHSLLISILSANVGCEVGAHILTEFVIRWKEGFDECQSFGKDVESSKWANLLSFVSYLFMFRVVDGCLIFDILNYLSQTLRPLQVQLILLVLRNVGFSLRKSDPLSLKKFISDVQTTAASYTEKSFTRMQFLLEVLMALKNNNMSKIPEYDPRHGEQLKSIMKACLHKGCSPSDLKVTLNDLIKSKVTGRWWIVGSAWSSGLKEEATQQGQPNTTETNANSIVSVYSERFMKKARNLHLTQSPRINIFYALTEGSEDCVECVQNILQLKIKSHQIQEIFNVMLLCCQKGKQYNSFYAFVAEKLCSHDRKHQGSLKHTLWDKFKELHTMKASNISNLSKFTAELICKDSINMAVFKKLSLYEPDAKTISFLRQTLIVILTNPSGIYIVERAFIFLCRSPKLRDVKRGIHSFMSKFISVDSNDTENSLLATRTKLALDILDKTDNISM